MCEGFDCCGGCVMCLFMCLVPCFYAKHVGDDHPPLYRPVRTGEDSTGFQSSTYIGGKQQRQGTINEESTEIYRPAFVMKRTTKYGKPTVNALEVPTSGMKAPKLRSLLKSTLKSKKEMSLRSMTSMSLKQAHSNLVRKLLQPLNNVELASQALLQETFNRPTVDHGISRRPRYLAFRWVPPRSLLDLLDKELAQSKLQTSTRLLHPAPCSPRPYLHRQEFV